jgi:hypothetical protein
VLVEVKGGERPVTDSARRAALDLLAYRRAFNGVLRLQPEPYGLGIAWGKELTPSADSELVLCTPDTIGLALARMV